MYIKNIFKKNCNKWKELDDILKNKRKDIRTIENKKKLLSQDIIIYITNHKLDNKKFKFNDGTKISLDNQITHSGFTIKSIKESLEEYKKQYLSSLNPEHCLEFIKNKRKKKNIQKLKRFSKK